MKVFLPLIVCIFLFSCSETKEETSKLENKEIIELTTNKIDPPDSILVMPMQLSLVEDSLAILKIGSDTYNFVLFDINNNKLFPFGLIGEGPNEVSDWVVFNDFNKSNRILQFFDMQRRSLLKISVNDIVNNSVSHFTVSPRIQGHLFSMIELDNGYQISTGRFPKRLRVSHNTEESYIIDYPFREELLEYSHNVLAMAYQGKLKIHPDQSKKILYFTFNSPNLDIFEVPYTPASHIKRHYWKPDFDGVENGSNSRARLNNTNKGGFRFGTVTSNFIYLNSPISSDKYTEVIIYDWEGNQHETLRFDTKVNAIAVSSDDSKIYAIEESSTSDLLWAEIPKN
ncbi:hypothetical protein [Peijinzhouia sedimentorum]